MKINRTIFAIIATALLLTIGTSLEAPAQQRPGVRKLKKAKATKQQMTQPPQAQPATDPPAKTLLSPRPEPVAIVNLAKPDYLSGEASVTVNPKQPTVIRLGLAQNAVSIVEFPAADGIYYVHEGNPKLASIFQSPTRETDRSITIYPGEAFVTSGDSNPSAAITLQMRSGLVIILELVPVSDIRRNAHRCVVNYGREEVINARRAAGLAYDLGEDAKTPAGKNTKASSKLFATADEPIPIPSPIPKADLSAAEAERAERPFVQSSSPLQPDKSIKSEIEISRLANRKLAETLRNPKKHLREWGTVVSGLSLAISKISDVDKDRRMVVVAVKNVTLNSLRLVPDSPQLQLQTQDNKGNPLQTERIERVFTETTTPDGLLLGGSTVYYAIVYRPPTMGVTQRLKILFAHTEAADAPASVSLSNATDGRKDR